MYDFFGKPETPCGDCFQGFCTMNCGPSRSDTVRLRAQPLRHSSVVGGGLTLFDEKGAARFIVSFIGTSDGIRPEETKALAEQFAAFVNNHDVVVPERR